ncbi:hypothetical protein TMS3_0114960 [Pseudomonas taeanensis MS-3]|uniref:DUF3703 domain-containing protein n=1 Tax=Pseudomonas taeanensis MS-3 TaxID=1395571 RepID=A0A0A1YII3_9PSED|nr:DUF3703 domain-containing protein [Pseudomonas taeanensis]KFX68788.1 hypothetical protein TMS3_0114960 [Pseudomonas taeanensis MS-3]
MKTALHHAIEEALLQADTASRQADYADAFRWLERAHILSQRQPLRHAHTHWQMLRLGWRSGDLREVAGQVPRIIAALLFSRIWVPSGNSGRARVSAFAPMPISDELQLLLREDQPPR